VTCLLADQYTKQLAVEHLKPEFMAREYVGGHFYLRYAENKGAMFSMGAELAESTRRFLMRYVTLAILLVLTVYLFVKRDRPLGTFIAFVLILSGGVGNLIDRFLYDYVVDFMVVDVVKIEMIGFHVKTAVFNIADMAVMGGVIYWILIELKTEYFNKKSLKKDLALEQQEEVL
jgi:signal peptidase II